MASKPLDALTRFEALAERWLEGGFARLFRTRLHRAELAEQLARALEDGRTTGPDGTWLAADDYQVFLHPDDYARLGDRQGQAEMAQELAGHLMAIAQQSGATLMRRPQVRFHPSDRVPLHQVQVQARLTAPRGPANPPPDTQEIDTRKAQETAAARTLPLACQLLIGERRFPLNASPVSLGRSLDNDVVIEHPRISRRHAQLWQRDDRWRLMDLGSANGTTVNDQPVSEAALYPGDVISLAGVEISFELQTPPGVEKPCEGFL